jgi:predicted nucleic acid-binding Zn ribbon protein
MPTYEYETLPAPGRKAKRFEIYQPITAAALTKHPETGEPIQRVISGGLGFLDNRPTGTPVPCSCKSGGETPCGLPPGAGCGGGMCGLE